MPMQIPAVRYPYTYSNNSHGNNGCYRVSLLFQIELLYISESLLNIGYETYESCMANVSCFSSMMMDCEL